MKQDEILQRREKIVTKLKLKDQEPGLQEARAILKAYLEERNMIITQEREYILWVIYHLDAPFDIDALHALVCQEKGRVCRATVYNNLHMFVDAGVVARFQPFVNGSQFFERCIGQKPHGYQVCKRCGAIKTVSLEEVIPPIAEQLTATFHTNQYCLYVLGLCATCYKEERHDLKVRQMAAKLEAERKKKDHLKASRQKSRTSIKEIRLERELQEIIEKKNKKKSLTK